MDFILVWMQIFTVVWDWGGPCTVWFFTGHGYWLNTDNFTLVMKQRFSFFSNHLLFLNIYGHKKSKSIRHLIIDHSCLACPSLFAQTRTSLLEVIMHGLLKNNIWFCTWNSARYDFTKCISFHSRHSHFDSVIVYFTILIRNEIRK